MASSLSYVEFVIEQMSGAGTVTWRRMFGEYGLYCSGKYFGCVCGGRALIKSLFVNRTCADCAVRFFARWRQNFQKGRHCRFAPTTGPAMPRSGIAQLLPDVEDRETLSELVRVTCAALPEKKSRKKPAKE